MTLTDHLNACVREINGIKGDVGARATFRAAVSQDATLRQQAAQAHAALLPAVTDKCHISRCEKAALEEVLAA